MKITHVSTSQRCEICHQSDQFDPVQEVCLRCARVEIIPRAPLSRPAPLPAFLADSLIPPPAQPKVKITLRGVIHFTLVLILALILNGGALLVACAFNEPTPNAQTTSSEEEWTFPRYQPKTVEEHLVESFDGISRVLLPGLWFGVANILLWIVISTLPKISKHFNHGKHGKHGKESSTYQTQYLRKFMTRYLARYLPSVLKEIELESS